MIIWGSKGKETVINTGIFFCPRCGVERAYKHKQLGKYFTLYFIPVFRTKDLGEFVECTVCNTPYEKSVLNLDPQSESALRGLLAVVKDEISSGQPLHVIYSALINNGATKEVANMVVGIATTGKMKQCKSCEFIYSADLSYCSNCGDPLSAIS
ncbi:MAG: zinc-ribbon domain-containing protein [Anaerolineales bacterium]|nr:zinc-ribbon domain-containing protein [Anaerolineales bacterium]